MAKKPYQLKTDITKQYIIDLCIVGEDYLAIPVVCDIRADGSTIIANAAESPELFQTHRYYDDFFQWLLYCSKIKLYNNDVDK